MLRVHESSKGQKQPHLSMNKKSQLIILNGDFDMFVHFWITRVHQFWTKTYLANKKNKPYLLICIRWTMHMLVWLPSSCWECWSPSDKVPRHWSTHSASGKPGIVPVHSGLWSCTCKINQRDIAPCHLFSVIKMFYIPLQKFCPLQTN